MSELAISQLGKDVRAYDDEKCVSDAPIQFDQYEDQIRLDERERVLLAIQDCIEEEVLTEDALKELHHFLNIRYNENR